MRQLTSELVPPAEVPSSTKITAALVSVVANAVLIALKLVVALLTGSLGILAEAAHSFLDLAASVSAFVGLRMAVLPADEAHPFGHHRFENLSGLAQILLLLLTTVLILWEALQRLMAPRPVVVAWYSFGVIGLSIAADFWMTNYLDRAARRAGGSAALQADALHFMNDLWSSIAVLAGLAFAAVGLAVADPLAAVVVALVVGSVAVRTGIRTTDVLVDRSPDAAIVRKVRDIILDHSEVRDVHLLRSRTMGSSVFLDVHVTLRPDLSLIEAHRICHEIEASMLARAPEVADVTIHAEPAEEERR